MRYLISISYDGSKFQGFQRLKENVSIQKVIEDALTKINKDKVVMKGADGIDKSKKYVEKAVGGVAKAMQLTMDSDLNYSLNGISGAVVGGSSGGTVNNYYNNDNSRTVNQTNNSPKSLSRLEIYRMTRNALNT